MLHPDIPLRGKGLGSLDLPDIGELKLNDHAFCLDDDVILQAHVDALVEESLPPGLASLGEIARTSELF